MCQKYFLYSLQLMTHRSFLSLRSSNSFHKRVREGLGWGGSHIWKTELVILDPYFLGVKKNVPLLVDHLVLIQQYLSSPVVLSLFSAVTKPLTQFLML